MVEPIKFFEKDNTLAIPAIPAIRELEARQGTACNDNTKLRFTATHCDSGGDSIANRTESHGVATVKCKSEEPQATDNKAFISDKAHGVARIAGIASSNSETRFFDITPALEHWQIESIMAWIRSLGGSPDEIADEIRDTISQCEKDAEARARYLEWAAEMPEATHTIDMTNIQTISVDEAIERTGSPLLMALASLARDENRIREKKITVRCMACQHWRPNKQEIGLAGECEDNRLPPTPPPKIINFGCTLRICQHYQSLETL